MKKTVIVIERYGDSPEVYGNFKLACDVLGLPYHTLKMQKFPFAHDNYFIHKVERITGDSRKK